jgi:hypothetical protein
MRVYASLLGGYYSDSGRIDIAQLSGDPNRHLVADGACTAPPRSASPVAGVIVIDMPLLSCAAGGGAPRRAWAEQAEKSGCPLSHYFTPLSRHYSAVLTL